jgi:hypothetical protein
MGATDGAEEPSPGRGPPGNSDCSNLGAWRGEGRTRKLISLSVWFESST